MSLSKTGRCLLPVMAASIMGAQAHKEHHLNNHHEQWQPSQDELIMNRFGMEYLEEESQDTWNQKGTSRIHSGRSLLDIFNPENSDISRINDLYPLNNDGSGQPPAMWIIGDQNVSSQYKWPDVFGDFKCNSCKVVTYLLSHFLDNYFVHNFLNIGGKLLCPLGTNFDHQTCDGLIQQQWGDALLPWISGFVLEQTNMCTFTLNLCDMDKWTKIDLTGSTMNMVRHKPEKYKSPDYVDKIYDTIAPKNKSELIKVAMMSDFHLSWDYTIGAANQCTKVLCCRSDSGFPGDDEPEKKAGPWGDFNCDIPIWTLNTMFDFMREELKPDAIMWAGDTIPHNLDSLTPETSAEIMRNTTQIVADALPDQKGKIFPTIGNHDTYPQDVFYLNERDQFFKTWGKSWTQFIDDDVNKETFLNHQYFAKNLTNNTRVLAINSNICYLQNWNSITGFNDPGNQLHWLVDQLTELEEMEGHAIILGHVPNLEECTRQWGHRLHAILDRFSHVISFGVYSHVHYHQMQVTRDLVAKQPVGVNFIVSSATPYQGKHPSLDVVYLDPETMRPVDYEIYYMDLDAANAKNDTKWSLYFDYRTGYNMTDLRPSNFQKIAERVFREDEVCNLYEKNRMIGGPGYNSTEQCSAISNFCQIVSSEEEDKFFCQGQTVMDRFHANNYLDTIANFINGAWYINNENNDRSNPLDQDELM